MSFISGDEAILKETAVRHRRSDRTHEIARVHSRHLLAIDFTGWLFLMPGLLAMTIFIFLPAGYVLFLSLQHWNLISVSPEYVGFRNYTHLMTAPDFRQAVVNTFWFGILLIGILLPLGLFVAVLLDMGLRGSRIYRTLIFAPYVVPLVASGLAFALMYNPNFGLINQVLALFHISGPDWLASSSLALPSIVAMTVWQYLGYYVLIFLAGLQNVAHALKEAAAVDGAGATQTFWNVVLPCITPSIFFAMIVCTIQAFQTFDQVFAMTQGGPAGATSTIVYYIFEQGFQMYNIGTASAASVLLLIFLAGLTWLQVVLGKKWVVYN